jgi:tetratricopeptide (TPR) repeat protein
VLYVYQRSILLACFFSLLALIAVVKRRPGWAILAFFFAFESKESALAVPLVLALFVFPGRWMEIPDWQGMKPAADRLFSGRALMIFASLVIAVLLMGSFALVLLADEKTVGLNTGLSPWQYLWTQTRVVYTYLRLLVFPYPQSLEYDLPNAGGIFAAAGILLILIAGWWWKSLSILAFFILLAPTSSIIPSADAAFEHRLYLPMLAVSVFVAHLMSKLHRGRTWVAVGVLAILAILTVRRERVWSSEIALWEDTVRQAPGKARVWFNLGGAYLGKDPDKARAALLRALELQPHWPEALYDLGLIEQDKKNWSGALAYYQQALAQNPNYWPACNNIGNTLFAMGEGARSLEFFERTLRLNPDYWPAQYNIAIVDFMAGRYRNAAARLRTVLDWRPDFHEARYLLATSLIRSGERSLADQELKKLSEMNAAGSRHTPTMILAPNRP